MSVKATVDKLNKTFRSGASKSYEFRVSQLRALKKMIQEEEKVILDGLAKDLGRCTFESMGLELVGCIVEIDTAIANLRSWMKPTYTMVPAMMAPATSEIVSEPYGVCLIIGAFNYPVYLTLGPLVGAIVAGNCAVIKPSEISGATEAVLANLLPKYLSNECYSVVCGGISTTTDLLDQKWDKIFFTGSSRVGKIVAAAAAKHLTPCSLELGGKSPTIIDESVTDIDLVTQRILWGKFANAGQTCIAPDYVLCHEKHYHAFLESCSRTVKRFYGDDPKSHSDFGRVVSSAHCKRLKAVLADSPGTIMCGGEVDEDAHYVAPTIVIDVRKDSMIMQEEIFGPILPVIMIKHIDEAITMINSKEYEKPLALYLFAKNRATIDRVTSQCTSGGALINDVMFHVVSPYVPFGGIGNSGLGMYHGKFSMDCFSHKRTIMRRDDHMILDIPFRYPPYTAFGLKVFRFAGLHMPALPSITGRTFTLGVLAAVGAAVVVTLKSQNVF